MSKKYLLVLSFLLVACSSTNHVSITEGINSNNTTTSFISTNEESASSASELLKESSSNIILSSSTLSTYISQTYNEDGSKKLPPPTKSINTLSQQETIFDFSGSFPEGFSYIYGHQILTNPSFYSSGWKITVPNSLARIGFQTPLFNSDLKIELRLYIGDIYNSNNKVDKDTPFITIYGFKYDGTLIRTEKINNLNNFYNYKNSKTPMNFYLNGENIDYLEVRFTAAPYKGSQCYNFAIKQIGFKTFPYPLN